MFRLNMLWAMICDSWAGRYDVDDQRKAPKKMSESAMVSLGMLLWFLWVILVLVVAIVPQVMK